MRKGKREEKVRFVTHDAHCRLPYRCCLRTACWRPSEKMACKWRQWSARDLSDGQPMRAHFLGSSLLPRIVDAEQGRWMMRLCDGLWKLELDQCCLLVGLHLRTPVQHQKDIVFNGDSLAASVAGQRWMCSPRLVGDFPVTACSLFLESGDGRVQWEKFGRLCGLGLRSVVTPGSVLTVQLLQDFLPAASHEGLQSFAWGLSHLVWRCTCTVENIGPLLGLDDVEREAQCGSCWVFHCLFI